MGLKLDLACVGNEPWAVGFGHMAVWWAEGVMGWGMGEGLWAVGLVGGFIREPHIARAISGGVALPLLTSSDSSSTHRAQLTSLHRGDGVGQPQGPQGG